MATFGTSQRKGSPFPMSEATVETHLELDLRLLRAIYLDQALRWPRIWLRPQEFRHSAKSARLWDTWSCIIEMDFNREKRSFIDYVYLLKNTYMNSK